MARPRKPARRSKIATNPYSSQTISGYNASPPADDGSEVESNRAEWDDVKVKLADPVKTLSESINSNILTAFGKVINTDADENNAMAGSLAFTESTLTIATGAVTALRRAHLIAAESGTADTLDTIATGSVSDGAFLDIRPDAGDTITVTDAAGGAGQIHLADNADYAMSGDMSLTLQRRGADWYEKGRDQVLPATQAQMEAGTANTVAVTPGRAHFHPSAVKGWVQYDHPAATIDASYNVTSVTDEATAGHFTVNWDTDLATAAYAIATGARATAATTANILNVRHNVAPLVGATAMQIVSDGGAQADADLCTVVAFGDL